MGIVGFNFSKITAQKSSSLSGKININNNISITDVKEMEVTLTGQKGKGLMIKFHYHCDYEPNMGKISLEGEVIAIEDQETIKKSIESWQKNKSLEKDLMERIMPHILNKSSIEAIILSKDVGLPSPIPLPKITNDKKAKETKVNGK